MGEKIGGQILILYNADRFSKKRKLYKKCGPDKVKDKDLIPLVDHLLCNIHLSAIF